MSYTVVETSLNRAEFRWKWLKFLQQSFVLGSILCLLVALLAGAILLGWLTNKTLATAFFGMVGVLGFIAWAIIIITVMAGAPDRNWLAAAVERVDRRLLDRLNTLLFLERRSNESRTQSFARRIARQTQAVIAAHASPSPFPAAQTMRYMLGFIVALAVTVAMYQTWSPWSRLLAAESAKQAEPAQPEQPLDLALPATNNVEQQQAWGEVRITDPAADLKVTKVDVVPLQIEAAANQALDKVSWFSTINSAGETPHELPPPAEPRYAVYQPTVYMDELHLSDWDVMTYYAKASTGQTNSYASEVYFLEVRPFREDILKLPGGDKGKAYECLNEMSTLISRQQHVIRQTHQHIQSPQPQEKLQVQDRKKLSEAEGDLSDSAQHLYAKMAAEMENKPVGEALDNLAKAEKSLDRASRLLDDNVMSEAQSRERSALAELVAARKIFQKAVSDNPGAFEEPKEEEPTPVADSGKKLNEMAEYRNEAKAAQEFVQKALEQQRNLEQQARAARNDSSKLAQQERQLEQSLEDFEQQHPQPFKGAEAESKSAQQAMTQAAESLQKKSAGARSAVQQASQQLEKLNNTMKNRSAEQQLAHAYRLKQMLDKQIQTLGKCANPGAGGSVSETDVQQTAGQARETVNQLKKVAEQEPTRDAFDQPLRDALSGQNKVDLDARLSRLQQAQDEAARKQRAGEAKESLSKVSKAFEASEPKTMQMARNTDSLKPGEQESFDRGLAQLESLIKLCQRGVAGDGLAQRQVPGNQAQNNRQVSPRDQASQEREAMANLRAGMRSLYGDNERGNKILAQLDEALRPENPADIELLMKIMAELQHFSVETSDRLAKKEDKPEVTNIDPAKLPPAYRGRIQKYFQKLSER
jgi:hypothetical protein